MSCNTAKTENYNLLRFKTINIKNAKRETKKL